MNLKGSLTSDSDYYYNPHNQQIPPREIIYCYQVAEKIKKMFSDPILELSAFNRWLTALNEVLKESKKGNIILNKVDISEAFDFINKKYELIENSHRKTTLEVMTKIKNVAELIYMAADDQEKKITEADLKKIRLDNDAQIKKFLSYKQKLNGIYQETVAAVPPSGKRIAECREILKIVDWIPVQIEPFLKEIIDLKELIHRRLNYLQPPGKKIPPPIIIIPK